MWSTIAWVFSMGGPAPDHQGTHKDLVEWTKGDILGTITSSLKQALAEETTCS